MNVVMHSPNVWLRVRKVGAGLVVVAALAAIAAVAIAALAPPARSATATPAQPRTFIGSFWAANDAEDLGIRAGGNRIGEFVAGAKWTAA